jgi:PAS domain S-box-containing protein
MQLGDEIGAVGDRKPAEEAAMGSEEELRQIIEIVPAIVWTALPDGRVDFINQRYRELTGASLEEAVGWSWEGLVHPEDREPVVGKWRASLATGQPLEAELRIRSKDGKYRWFASRGVPVRDEQGNILKWYGLLVDIDDRKRAEHLTGEVFVNYPDAMSVIGDDYRYQRVNPAYERLSGMPGERIVGKHVADLLGTEWFEQKLKPLYDRCFAGEEVRIAEWFSNTGSGDRRYLAVSYSPLRPASERVEAILVVARDLTDQMLASEALREAQAGLAHANRLATMGQLTASIAHEVTQPIAAARTNASAGLRWLSSDPPEAEEVRQAFCSIIENAEHARDILDRIRALVRKAPPRQDRFDLNDAVLNVIALSRSGVQKHDVSLQTELAPDLPAVIGDRVQLQQVILNLILNAVEAMSGLDEGAREVLVSTKADALGEVVVAVTDTGPGLEPQAVGRVFEAFYTTKPGGLGMGLAICHSIIEAHGGRLWASTNEPRGAVFQFTLSLERNDAAHAGQGPVA